MNEQLIVKNFGPIKDATVDFKKVTVFIGPTGGGKSTLAKLAAIFRDIDFYVSENGPRYLFDYYNLESYSAPSSELQLKRGIYGVKIKGRRITYDKNTQLLIKSQAKQVNKIALNRSRDRMPELSKTIQVAAKIDAIDKDELDEIIDNVQSITDELIENTSREIIKLIFSKIFIHTHPVYVPSERVFISSLNNSWAGLLRDDIGLPGPLLTFANNYAQFRTIVSDLPLPMFGVDYIHKNGNDFIKVKNKNKPLNLHETASGIQSTTPLLVVLEHLSHNTSNSQSFIIEEPELNLYPTAQQGLLNWLVEKCTAEKNDLTITTHSLYILSHLNLLLYAYQVADKHPDRADDVAKIVPRESWINPKDFACYQVEGGGVQSLVDEGLGLIDNNELDALSSDAADAFDNLIRLSKSVAIK
jgi:predicted ATPase